MNLTNPICIMLKPRFDAAIVTIQKAKQFQVIIKAQMEALEAETNLNSYLGAIPDIPIHFDASQINSILNSCPGMFGSISSINLELSKGMKDYIKAQKINPLGGLSALSKALDDKMKPINILMNDALGWLQCMKNLCGLEDAIYNSYLSSLNGLKSDIGLVNGKSQVLSPNAGYCKNMFDSKIATIKSNAKALSKL